ncbi:hypothetical protein NKH77_19565 [Streptomyces sp. M19]
MRHLVYFFGGAAALGAASYVVIYLYRWQWQRAILCGVLLLVVEVLLLGLALLGRVARLEERMDRRMAALAAGGGIGATGGIATTGGFGTTGGTSGIGGTGGIGGGRWTAARRPTPGTARPRAVGRAAAGGRAGPAAAARRRAHAPLPVAGRPRDTGDPGTHRTHVFVPVLMVTGVVLSGLAWVVQRIAEFTVRRSGAERRLAGRLTPLTVPPLAAMTAAEPYVIPGPETGTRADAGAGEGREAREVREGKGKGRARGAGHLVGPARPGGPAGPRPPFRPQAVALAGAALAGAGLLAGLVVGLADLTQTREEHEKDAAATSVLVKVVVRNHATEERVDMAAHQVWERCRDSTSVPLRRAVLSDLGGRLYAGVIYPALAEHDRMRLRGCLEDTGVDRTHFVIVGIGQTDPDDD